VSAPAAPSAPLPDAEARARIEADLGSTFLVEAGAGSGKTTGLVGRLVRLLASGRVSVDQVCAITFTRKAAGELRLRLREALEQVRAADDPEEAARAAAALARLEGAAVGTIHGFAAAILRERPLEANLDPDFRAEDQSLARLETHLRDWLALALDRDDPLLRRYLVAHGGSEESLRHTLTLLWDHRDLRAVGPGTPAWDRDAETPPLLDRVRSLANRIRPALAASSKTFAKLEPLLELGEVLDQAEDPSDLDRGEAQLLALDYEVFGKSRLREREAWSVDEDAARALRGEASDLLGALDRYERAARLDVAQRLIPRLSRLLVDPADPTCAQERLLRAGLLDSLGLLVSARDLVRRDLQVRRAFQRRYQVLLVDELQDTDPLQLELIALLAAPAYEGDDWREALRQVEPGRLFLVGDPKQGIYRWRRADIDLYRQIKADLVTSGAGEVLELTTNFRCRPGLAELVNAAFPAVFAGRPDHHPDYAPIVARRPPCPRGQAPVISLDLRAFSRLTDVRAEEPEAVAAFLARSLDLGGAAPPEPLWVEDPQTREVRTAQPRDVAFLFRQFVRFRQDLTAPYVRALADHGIPAVLFAGSSFRGREEVDAAITALRAIEHPEDPIAVYGTLRGPFFAHPETELLGDRPAPPAAPLGARGGARLAPLPRRAARGAQPRPRRADPPAPLRPHPGRLGPGRVPLRSPAGGQPGQAAAAGASLRPGARRRHQLPRLRAPRDRPERGGRLPAGRGGPRGGALPQHAQGQGARVPDRLPGRPHDPRSLHADPRPPPLPPGAR
jgi:superfamily I DNA/RNA helicase